MTLDIDRHFGLAQSLGRWLKRFLILSVCASAIAVLCGVDAYHVISELASSDNGISDELRAHADRSDTILWIVGCVQVALYVISGLLWLAYVNRSNHLARALGATGLRQTPGWSVGWYFVPVMNLFRPYQGMRDILLATRDPAGFSPDKDVRGDPVVKIWWALFFIQSSASRISLHKAKSAETLPELLNSALIDVAADIIAVIAMASAIALVRALATAQAAAHAHWRANPEVGLNDIPADGA